LSGKSPICEDDLLGSLSGSLGPCFPAGQVAASESPAVTFLLERRILVKGYEPTVICDRCAERCEVPVEADASQRFFICPTGYFERPVLVSEEDVCVYRFEFAAFRAAFAKQNGLRPWSDVDALRQPFYSLARGLRGNRHVAAIYALRLDARNARITLTTVKDHLKCDGLIVLSPCVGHYDKALAKALTEDGIAVVPLGSLLARQAFHVDMPDVAEPETLDENALYTHARLAELFGLPEGALRKRLERYRQTNLDHGWEEIANRRVNEPKYRYELRAVKHIIEDMLASTERPAK